jgi:hypothetical protein
MITYSTVLSVVQAACTESSDRRLLKNELKVARKKTVTAKFEACPGICRGGGGGDRKSTNSAQLSWPRFQPETPEYVARCQAPGRDALFAEVLYL